MTWSTREVAELAGTTVNTVRHYHREGLLEEPERMSNGYKQYGVRHLVRLLQIRRLRDLGVALDQIEHVGVGAATPLDALRAVDADLAVSIERMQRARAEIKAILEGGSVTGVPAGFEDVATKLSAPDQSLMLIYSQLYDDRAMADIRAMVLSDPDGAEFEALAADADEATRIRVADQLAPALARHLDDYPWLTDPTPHLRKGPDLTKEVFLESVVALYNPAQLDVLGRAAEIAKHLRTATEGDQPGLRAKRP